MRTLLNRIEELEQDRSLDEPGQLRQRLDALDLLDACLPGEPSPNFDAGTVEAGIRRRASALRAQLEQANRKLYQTIRGEIQRGSTPQTLLQWTPVHPDAGQAYDFLDELISGVLQLKEPDAASVHLGAEMVFYQPTPARHIFDLMRRAAFTEQDVLIDLGSGLGHVPLLVSICAGIRAVGVEIEPAYIASARKCANELNLGHVTFLPSDARQAGLSSGTVFYLYTPFTGTILRAVLERLRQEAASRAMRVCSFGPCTATIAQEPWLKALGPCETGRIAVFSSQF
jgi:hypothetical protein